MQLCHIWKSLTHRHHFFRVIFEDGTKCEKFWSVTLKSPATSHQTPETDFEVAPCNGVKDSAKLVQPGDLRVHNGRVLYKEDGKDSWLFYSRGHWYLGPDIGNPNTANYESMKCPLKGHKMLNPVFVTIDGSDVNPNDAEDWTECSDKCARLNECKHWQYDQENQKCLLVKGFSTFKAVQKSMISSIETETVDEEHADTGNKIQIEIKCGDEKCLATLDNPNKEKFQRGATDTFTGNIIENCNKLTCSTDLKMKLINKGVDGWSPKSTR